MSATHTHNRLTAVGLGLPGRPVPEETLTHSHPSWSSDILYQLPPFTTIQCSVYVLDCPLWQPLFRSSLVFLLVLDPLLHTPCIYWPSRLLFAVHARTYLLTSANTHKMETEWVNVCFWYWFIPGCLRCWIFGEHWWYIFHFIVFRHTFIHGCEQRQQIFLKYLTGHAQNQKPLKRRQLRKCSCSII